MDKVAPECKMTKGNLSSDDLFDPDNIFKESLDPGQITSLCQQDLLSMGKKREVAAKMRLEIVRLAERQAEIQEEYTTVVTESTRYNEQRQELAKIEDEVQRDCCALKERQEVLDTEHAQISSEQQAHSSNLLVRDEKLDGLMAAKCEAETAIVQNLEKRQDVTARLARLSGLVALAQQEEVLQEAIIDQESKLNRLEEEKKKLVECLSLLTAHKPETCVVLSSNREEQIFTVAQYNQYLIEFAAVAQKVEHQGQAPATPFLSQDIKFLLDRIATIKQRQFDLKFSEKDIVNQFDELSQVLIDTAKDYGWTTSLLRSDPQEGVVVTYQSIGRLREAANDLLWASPPGIVARLGFSTQWKKTLFNLIIRAKAMEQQVNSPGTIYAQTITEIESILLECRYLTQRIYEACYRHLLACGQSLDRSCNELQERLAVLIRQLQKSSKEVHSLTGQINPDNVAEELCLQQSLAEIEYTLQQAQAKLQKQELALYERQCLLPEPDIKIAQRQAEYQNNLEDSTLQLADIEKQLKAKANMLAEVGQRLAELRDLVDLSYNKMEELTCEKKDILQRIQTITVKLADVESCFKENMVRASLTTEWIGRINEIQYLSESGIIITDKINSQDIASIAQSVISRQPGLVLLETREWVLPVAVISVKYTLAGYRRYNIIEEFIMKCIFSGLDELRSQQGIAGLLRLDEVIVENGLSHLLQHRLLVEGKSGGKTIYELSDKEGEIKPTALISIAPHSRAVLITINAQYELIDCCKQIINEPGYTEPELPVFRYFNQQEEQILRSDFQLSDEEAINIAQQKIKEGYIGDLNNLVVEMREPQHKQDINRRFGEIWVYDAVNNQVFCHIWNFGQRTFCEKLAFALNLLEAEHRLQQVSEQAKPTHPSGLA